MWRADGDHDARLTDFKFAGAVNYADVRNLEALVSFATEPLEFTLTGLYPGVSASAAKERTGWDLAIAADPEIIAAPSPAELDALRRFQGTQARSHQL